MNFTFLKESYEALFSKNLEYNSKKRSFDINMANELPKNLSN